MSDDSQGSRSSPLRESTAVDTPRGAFDYTGGAGDLAKIATVNALLGIVTLGIYRFWGKTRLRRYFWSHVSFEGDPLEYTGRGMEIFLGFLIVIAILLPVGFLIGVYEFSYTDRFEVRAKSGLIQAFVLTFLINIALFRARRYRLTRTQWRGIRGGQTGSSVRYALLAFGWIIVTALTLGLAYPVMQTRLQKYLIENTWFGSQDMRFDGEAKALFRRWLVAWLLLIPTLGLSWVWYRVQAFRYFASQTRYGDLGFASELSFRRVVWIAVRFFLVWIATLALLSFIFKLLIPAEILVMDPEQWNPSIGAIEVLMLILYVLSVTVIYSVLRIAVFLHPLIREVSTSLTVTGQEDFDAIRQSADEQPRFGEGLADALDVGGI